MPIVALPGLSDQAGQFQSGDTLEVDFASGELLLNGKQAFQAQPFSGVQMDIYQAGDLFAYGKALER